MTTLVERRLAAGPGSTTWDGRDASGARVASGVYVYRLDTADASVSGKLVLIK